MSDGVIRMIAVCEYAPDPENYPDSCDSIEDMASLDFEAFCDDPFFFFDLDTAEFDYEFEEAL